MPLNILPSVESQTFRANLAQLLSPLRRVRPRVPFFELAAHRIPTLWGLYRGLLREAPTEDVRGCEFDTSYYRCNLTSD